MITVAMSKMQRQIFCLFVNIAEIVSARAAVEINLISPLHGLIVFVLRLIEMHCVFSQILPDAAHDYYICFLY